MTRAIPVQARAKARYEAILSAAQAHYAEVGRDRFNLDAVSEMAGCSVGTIYRYFEDRVTLLEIAIPDLNKAERQIVELHKILALSAPTAAKMLAIEKLLS